MSAPAMRMARRAKENRVSAGCLLAAFMAQALVAPVMGLSTDRDQPIEIEADFVEIEDELGVAVYRGNVIVTQGTMRFTGDILTVTYVSGQEIKEFLLEGQPAHFKQRPDNEDEDIKGESLHMRYEVQKDLVHLIEKAKVTQRGQIYTGHRAIYDRRRNILTAYRAEPGEVGTSGQPIPVDQGRVRIIIPPQAGDEPVKKPKKSK